MQSGAYRDWVATNYAARDARMKILLLGKNGQVGWELQRALAPLGELVALDFAAPGRSADFSQPESLAATVRAVAAGRRSSTPRPTPPSTGRERARAGARRSTPRRRRVLAREAAASGAWLVHYSTDYVFDGSGSAPRDEDAPTGPLSVYGAHQARRRAARSAPAAAAT